MRTGITVTIQVELTEVNYGTDTYYQYAIRGFRGIILALPFYGSKETCQGYLFYHNPDFFEYNEEKLKLLGLSTLHSPSPSGRVENMNPLPYSLVAKEDVIECLNGLIAKNTKTTLNKSLSL